MPKKIYRLFPRPSGKATYLYLVGGHDGSIKVGRTKSPDARARVHRQQMGSNFAWVHLFAYKGGGACERGAILELEKAGGTRETKHRETFHGVHKAVALSVCRKAIDGLMAWEERWRREAIRRKVEAEAWAAFKAIHLPDEVKAAA